MLLASGKRWNHQEILKEFETIFAPYAKKNASYVVEATLAETSELFVANVLWKNAILASEQRIWMHRMSVVLLPVTDDWEILLAQASVEDQYVRDRHEEAECTFECHLSERGTVGRRRAKTDGDFVDWRLRL
jgi:hypothetical protein